MDCCGHGHALTPRPWMSEHGAGLGRRDARRRCRTARFDRRRPDGRDRLCRARCPAQIHLRRCPYAWRQDRDHVEGAAERRSRERHAGGIACGRMPRRRAGRPVLGRNAEGVLAAVRTPEPGQLYRHHLERLAWMDEMVADHGLRRALSAADLEAAHKAGQPAIIADVEGLDFLETQARAARGSASARHQAPAARALHAERHRRFPDRRRHASGAHRVRRRGDPRLPPARLRLRRRARDRGHGEAGGQSRDETPAAVAHRSLRVAGDGADPAARAADQPRTMRGRSPRPAARSASGTSSRASTNTSTA